MDISNRSRALAVRIGLLLAGLAVLAIVVNLSWFDERLRPEIERIREPEFVPMENNAYPLIYGFPAADDRDPRAAGIAIVDALRARYRDGEPISLHSEAMSGILGPGEPDEAWQAGIESLPCNPRLAFGCADRLRTELGEARNLPRRLTVLLERYDRIVATSGFRENQEFDVTTPVPAYGLLLAVDRIRLASAYQGEAPNSYVARVAQDLAFWRGMLLDGQSLIAKMVALAGILNDLDSLSSAIRNGYLEDDAIAGMERLVPRLTPAEKDIGEAFVSEFRIALLSGKTVILPPGKPSWLTALLLQENATLNEFYVTSIIPVRLRAALDAATFFSEHGYEPLTYSLRSFPPPIYNLGGKLLLKQQSSSFNVQDYVSRVHDVDGRIALLLLQAEIRRYPGRSAESTVRASAHRNPYTGEPMDFEAASRTVSFDCLSGNANDVCAVALGDPAQAANP